MYLLCVLLLEVRESPLGSFSASALWIQDSGSNLGRSSGLTGHSHLLSHLDGSQVIVIKFSTGFYHTLSTHN